MLLNCGVGEDSWESQQGDQTSKSERKSTLNIHWKDWCWSRSSNTLATWCKNWLIWKDPDAGKDWRQEEKGMTEDEMIGWHHQLNGHEFEKAPAVGDRQGSLAYCSPWGCKESAMTEQLNWTGWTCMYNITGKLIGCIWGQMRMVALEIEKRRWIIKRHRNAVISRT